MEAIIDKNEFNTLATRAGFNSALRHFKTALGFSGDIEEGYNLADVLNQALDDSEIEEHQVRPIANILLAEKFGYAYKSHNLKQKIEHSDPIVENLKDWNNIQFILVCYSSGGETFLVNPKNPAHWETVLPLASDEFVVCFAGSLVETSEKTLENALKDFYSVLYGKKVKAKTGYSDPKAKPMVIEEEVDETPVEEEKSESGTISDAPIQTGRKRMTKQYAVNVTNELFHNGNVEAWKRIIQSYIAKYPDCEVHVWYEGEKINDINALFKWGKVKHGTPVMFSVAGQNIQDVSKLRKYLYEGASIRFEAFLHGPPGSVLDLF